MLFNYRSGIWGARGPNGEGTSSTTGENMLSDHTCSDRTLPTCTTSMLMTAPTFIVFQVYIQSWRPLAACSTICRYLPLLTLAMMTKGFQTCVSNRGCQCCAGDVKGCGYHCCAGDVMGCGCQCCAGDVKACGYHCCAGDVMGCGYDCCAGVA